MKIIDISVAVPTTLNFDGKQISTGIFKKPVVGRVNVESSNLDGDRQADLTVHGGPQKAVYAYPIEHYGFWRSELARPALEVAQFGENLTVEGAPDDAVIVGARYGLGDVILRVTQPRIPCYKLGARLNDARFPQRFWEAGRLGYYLAVERTGQIEAGMAGSLIDAPDHGITVSGLHRVVTTADAEGAQRALDSLTDLDDGWHRRLRRALAGESQ